MSWEIHCTDEARADLGNLDGSRVVYALIRTETAMKTVVIAARSDDEVCEIAAKRTK